MLKEYVLYVRICFMLILQLTLTARSAYLRPGVWNFVVNLAMALAKVALAAT